MIGSTANSHASKLGTSTGWKSIRSLQQHIDISPLDDLSFRCNQGNCAHRQGTDSSGGGKAVTGRYRPRGGQASL